MTAYPEHDKLHKVEDLTQAIGEFLDWASEEEGVHLMSTDDGGSRPYMVSWYPLLAKWAGIDLGKLDQEKRAMLAEVRKANEQRSGA